VWGKPPRDRKVENPRRVGSRKRQANSADTQDSRALCAVAFGPRRLKRGRGWPGNTTVSQDGGGEHPRGKPHGSHRRHLLCLKELFSGNKALKRTCSGRLERHQGTARGQGPGNRYPSAKREGFEGGISRALRFGEIRSARFVRDSKPLSGSKPRKRRELGRKACARTERTGCAVETRNLKRAIAGGRDPRGSLAA
jgi:hypothetical protein